MPRPADLRPQRLAGRGFLIALVALAAMPSYFALDPTWRPAALRLACAAIVLVASARALGWARGLARRESESPLDAALPEAPEPELDPRFLGLRDDIAYSAKSRRYFDVVLWPRLVHLGGPDLPRPPERRRWRRRGPPLHALEQLIARIEERP